MHAPTVVPIRGLSLVRDLEPWAFAERHREDIDGHFARLKAANPTLWNGRLLLLARHTLVDGVLNGGYFETDFASFMWWRDNAYPDPAIRNAFAMGALCGADGGFVLGRMASWTANAGRIYFAAGTPEPDDVLADGRVDLAGSVFRELTEETGLGPADVLPDQGWQGVFAGPRIALMRRLVAHEDSETLAARVRAHLATEERPELDDVVVLRGPQDLSPAVPDFVSAYLRAVWADG